LRTAPPGRRGRSHDPLPLIAAALSLAIACTAADAQRSRRAAAAPAAPPATLTQLADEVSERQLRVYVERLVSFGTRHTLSSQDHPTRGIGAALNWTEEEFRRISRHAELLTTARPSDDRQRRRIPTPTRRVRVSRGSVVKNRPIWSHLCRPAGVTGRGTNPNQNGVMSSPAISTEPENFHRRDERTVINRPGSPSGGAATKHDPDSGPA
jgi:hypothetical protein